MSDSRRLVDKLWSYCNVLRNDGVGVIEYTEQLTYLLLLKMAHERSTRKLNPQQIIPDEYSWQKLLDAENPLRRHHLDELVDCYLRRQPRDELVGSQQWKSFSYQELIARDKVSLDITWLRDESLEDADNLPAPEVIGREIVEDLTAALAEFEAVAAALEAAANGDPVQN